MAFKKYALVCALIAAAFFAAGCESKESKLNLPESEMKQVDPKVKATCELTMGFPEGADRASGGKFYVYADKGFFKNHFSPSGWMGDYGDMKCDEGWTKDACSRKTCIRIGYSAKKAQGAGWAGMYWQEPANNWGNVPGGFDLTGAKRLTFWAKGEKGGEVIAEFKIGGIQGEFSDSTSVSIGPIVLTPEWKQYTIDLKTENLSRIIGGFAFVLNAAENPDGAVFYLDDIIYEA